MNTITFTGNLAATPESGTLPSGDAFVELVVLENRRVKDKETGEWHAAEPNRFTVKAYGKLASNVADSVDSGSTVTVTVRTDRWDDKAGRPRTAQWVKADDVALSLRYSTR